MSHFAKVENGIVTEVIVAEQEFINSGAVGDSFLWIQCSYNNNFRGKYAAIGGTYSNGIFTPPSPFPSWVLDSDNNWWDAPVDYPTDDKAYAWNEETTNWITSE